MQARTHRSRHRISALRQLSWWASRLDRAALLRGTALQAATALTLALPAPILPAYAQPAPNARPQGGQVVGGSATIGRAPGNTTITQVTALPRLKCYPGSTCCLT